MTVVDSRSDDQRTLLSFIRESHAVRDRAAFVAETIATLPGVVPAEACWFREFTRWPPHVILTVHPAEVKQKDSERALERCMDEHPGIAYRQRTFDPQAIQLSDFVTTVRLHRLPLYREYYRSLGVEYQMSVALDMGPSAWVVVALGRARVDFSARDRRCLNLLLPHLVGAYRAACALSGRRGLLPTLSVPRADPPDLMILNGTRVRLVPPWAQALLIEYFGSSGRSGYLPDPVERWVRHHTLAQTRATGLPPPRQPLVVERVGRRLAVWLFSDRGRNSLFLQEKITDRLVWLLSLGLTAREAQILSWLAQGKSNREIGTALDIRPRTVGKHLERIFLKLGVESRTSALVKALGLRA